MKKVINEAAMIAVFAFAGYSVVSGGYIEKFTSAVKPDKSEFNQEVKHDFRRFAIETYGVGIVAYAKTATNQDTYVLAHEFKKRLDVAYKANESGSAWALSMSVIRDWEALDNTSLYEVDVIGRRGCDIACTTLIKGLLLK